MRGESEAWDERPWLIADDWQSRSLLLAELKARGIEMRAEPGLRWAMHALLRERLCPPLILLDSKGDSEATPARVERLLRLLPEGAPSPALILIVPTFEREIWQERFAGRATILPRPQRVGQVAEVVCRALAQG